MADDVSAYATGSANWRKTLRQNATRTYQIIVVFVLVYLAVGLILDTLFAWHMYPHASVGYCFTKVATLQHLPVATLIMLAIAVISLLVTYWRYDKLMLLGTKAIEINQSNINEKPEHQQLYNVVEEMKIASSMAYMPKVFIIDADYMNAFASGYSEKFSMIVVTRGLLTLLDRQELQAVIAHELSHIRHNDIKLTLTATVLANIMIIVIDILFRGIIYGGGRRRSSNRDGGGGALAFILVIMVLRIVLPTITMVLLLYLSRTREYMADAGAVELMRDNRPLASALLKIENDHKHNKAQYTEAYQDHPHEGIRRQSYIYDPQEAGIKPVQSFVEAFSTHPSMKKRLAAIGFTEKSHNLTDQTR